jgi:2-polyprenyl-3-methyl-5-hydroxy-6-metoxy-1,4-benzoquinol methylase
MINCQNKYAKIINRNRELTNLTRSILEVGAGFYGIAEFLKRPVTGIDTNVKGQANEWLNLQKGGVLNIKFPDDSFDFVICVDVLEHIPPKKD